MGFWCFAAFDCHPNAYFGPTKAIPAYYEVNPLTLSPEFANRPHHHNSASTADNDPHIAIIRKAIGHAMPAFTNPSDFVMDLVVDPSDRAAAEGRRKQICDDYSRSRLPPNQKSDSALASIAVAQTAPSALNMGFCFNAM